MILSTELMHKMLTYFELFIGLKNFGSVESSKIVKLENRIVNHKSNNKNDCVYDYMMIRRMKFKHKEAE